jgi:hypothetical protein
MLRFAGTRGGVALDEHQNVFVRDEVHRSSGGASPADLLKLEERRPGDEVPVADASE